MRTSATRPIFWAVRTIFLHRDSKFDQEVAASVIGTKMVSLLLLMRNPGKALAGDGGFVSRGFDVVAIFDADQMVVGNEVGWLRVSDAADMEAVLQRTGANMVVLALPATVAQAVCDRVVAAGVHSILSFAPVMLPVPEGVNLRPVALAPALQTLSYPA